MRENSKVLERLAKGPMLLDGGIGTELMRAGLAAGEQSEGWLLTNLQAVKDMHAAYAAAGAELLYTNSFGASSVKLAKTPFKGREEEINRLAVEAARAAAPGLFIFGSMGPLGELLEPYGDLTQEEVRAAFRRQAGILIGAGADGVAIETHTDIREVSCAIEAAREAGAGFIISTMSFDGPDKQFKTMMGNSPEEAAEAMLAAGADAIGANCGAAVADMPEVMRRIGSKAKGKPLVSKTNAGLPVHTNGNTFYPMTPAEFREVGAELLKSGVAMIGGCCGTTPEHIAALRDIVRPN